MKKATTLVAGISIAVTFLAKAQVSPSKEPKASVDQVSGQMLLLPSHSTSGVALLMPESKTALRIKNIAQTREPVLLSSRNGYYVLGKGRDWGTNIRMHSFSD